MILEELGLKEANGVAAPCEEPIKDLGGVEDERCFLCNEVFKFLQFQGNHDGSYGKYVGKNPTLLPIFIPGWRLEKTESGEMVGRIVNYAKKSLRRRAAEKQQEPGGEEEVTDD